MTKDLLFVDYYKDWIETYKKGVVADVTYQKYEINLRHIERIIPDIKLKDLDRRTFQYLINKKDIANFILKIGERRKNGIRRI